jgi:hypothetical protein
MLRSRLLFVVASAMLAACTTSSGDNTIVVLHDQLPASGCVLTADVNGAFRSAGRMDLHRWVPGMQPEGYILTPLVANYAVADETIPTELMRRTVLVRGAHVDIKFNSNAVMSDADQQALDDAGLLHFDVRFAGAIAPNMALAAFTFQAVPAGVFDAIKRKYEGLAKPAPDVDMLASVVIYGDIGSGAIESSAFEFPVTACDGCLTNMVGPCEMVPTTFMARTGGVCSALQDDVIDCCTDSVGGLLCPAAAPAPTGT